MQHMDAEEWLMYGWKQGYCSAPHCAIHDGMFLSVTEEELMDEGSDPCIHVIRLYEDNIELEEIESNNSAATWRASNRGWSKDA
jgi:hypothetical protein